MPDEKDLSQATSAAPAGTTDASHATTEISYCPFLGLYHYKRANGDEYLFDVDKLELSIMAYVRQGDPRQAEFMAGLTGLARQYPHCIVTLQADMSFKVLVLESRKEEQPGSGDNPPALVIKK